MKILNFEDDVFKHNDILKAIGMTGRHEVVWVRNVEDGFACIREGAVQGAPFDLVITDMHFPLSAGGEDCLRAGYVVMEELEKRRLSIPVIVCSSMNVRPAGAYGAVWYSGISDWDTELAELVRRLDGKSGQNAGRGGI